MKRTEIAANATRLSGKSRHGRKAIPLLVSLAAPVLGACSMTPVETASTTAPSTAAKQPHELRKRAIALAKADPREKECLVRAMYFESNRSSESGLLGVGTVVMNRVESGRFADTVCGVAHQPRQFFNTRAYNPNRSSAMWKSAVEVSREAMAGHTADVVPGALFYHATYIAPPRFFRSRPRAAVLGDHIFYR